jgi:hypothetical protein
VPRGMTKWSKRGEHGSSAQVCLRTKKHTNRCMVGYLLWKDADHLRCDPLLIGEGRTWEEAFACADTREARGLPPLRMGFL